MLIKGEEDVIITGEVTPEKLAYHVDKMITQKGYKSFKYPKDKPHHFQTKQINKSIKNDLRFKKIMFYMLRLTQAFDQWKYENIHEETARELRKWDSEGLLCYHMSILNYYLLLKSEVVTPNQVKFVQGFYIHPRQAVNMFVEQFFSETISGRHAWLTVNNAVLDFTIIQEKTVFALPSPFIFEEIPKDMNLHGFVENSKTVKKYGRDFAKFRKMDIEEWVEFHFNESEKLYERATKND